MAITWTNVSDLIGAGLPVVSVNGQAAILAVVNGRLPVSKLDGETGPVVQLARCYLAAHFAALGKLGSVGGPLTAQTSGPESRSYGVLPLNQNEYTTTQYGRAFWLLVQPFFAGPVVL